jgi:hypothetical protein
VLEDLVDPGTRQRAVSLFLRGEPAIPVSPNELPERRLAGFTGCDEDLGTRSNSRKEREEDEKRRGSSPVPDRAAPR